MITFCKIIAITILIATVVLTLFWIAKFPQKVKKISDCNVSDFESIELYDIYKSKQFFKQITKLFLINFCAFIISVIAFIVNIILSEGIPFYSAPLIILLCGGASAAIALDIFIKIIGNKNKIKVLNHFDKKLYPLGLASTSITSICIFIGFFFSEVVACAIYMIQLMI
ncbi:MAG: hypothetical protein ACI4MQ_08500 [Candidatus Coproplasma sp.]